MSSLLNGKQSLRLFNVHWQGIPIGVATKKHRALMKAEQRDYWWVGAFSLSALSDSMPIKVKKIGNHSSENAANDCVKATSCAP